MQKDFDLQHPVITIKSYMTVFLIVLSIVSIITFNNYVFGLQLIFIPIVAMLLDVVINIIKIKKLILPSSGLITGLLVAMILPPSALYIQTATVIAAILSKHIIKWKGRHIFNPAAFGIIFIGFTGITASWWAATTLLVIPLGLFLIWRLRKFTLSLTFLATYYVISAILSYPNIIATAVLDTTAIFFAFFMLIEPMTSTTVRRAQLAEGIFVGVLVFVVRALIPQTDLFLFSLLVANIFVSILNKKLRPQVKPAQIKTL